MLASTPLLLLTLLTLTSAMYVPEVRLPIENRTFTSSAVDDFLSSSQKSFTNQNLHRLFTNTLPNTLDTTIFSYDLGTDTFIITGDINAMWLRDSCNQVLPYMRFVGEDEELKGLMKGLVKRMSKSVLIDSYANAFNFDSSLSTDHADDVRTPPMSNLTFEGKYELDSLAAFLKLSRSVYAEDHEVFDGDDMYVTYLNAVNAVTDTIRRQQMSTSEEMESKTGPAYTFSRFTTEATDTLMQNGKGAPCARTNMSKCMFRPSDDATTLPFLVPANAMAVVELRETMKVIISQLARKADTAHINPYPIIDELKYLADEIDEGIQTWGKITHPITKKEVYAYEVDGYGNFVFMDDANIPGLLSLPYLGYVDKNDPVYLNTREAVLSEITNPFFFKGRAGEGIGGPHQGYGMIWPMGITVRALTSTDANEIKECLEMLVDATAHTGFMHESFWKDDANDFTRTWFAWANSLFGELIMTLMDEHPELL
ncbi:hypothetical protein TrLO_g1742 [Triparma laevis f. longispina]|uniref:Glycoside hydrolase family 125 protein n=1 Tax=Triparma laevis f. longispina TaxID=1714387 RepID=A0A9W7C7P8_9STRA|nr:hypothetical protein TrLO_g1742 [Triparma laevis f. longispina]